MTMTPSDALNALRSLDLSKSIIAVDFDGTCVTHDFPAIGREVAHCVKVLKALTDAGARLILWTIRSDKEELETPSPLTERADAYASHASLWFHDRDIPVWAVNHNPQQGAWSSSPKAYAHLFIDDAALGCPLVRGAHERPFVDWYKIAGLLVEHFQTA